MTATDAAADVLLQFGAAMLRAGGMAVRTTELVQTMSRRLNVDTQSVRLSPENIAICFRRADELVTVMRDIAPPATNAWRIGELERLASSGEPVAELDDILRRLAAIENAPPHHSATTIAASVGVASGAFAFLNGAAMPEIVMVVMAGGGGQWTRSWLSRRLPNQFGAAALSGMVASGLYVLAAALAGRAGFGFSHYHAGLMSSVLFLVPGFPLIAGLFDLVQHQTATALSRMAYGAMILLAVASGLSIVVAIADIGLSRQPSLELAYPLKLTLRAIASFIAGSAFAMLFNSTPRTLLLAGVVALVANSLRLIAIDWGMQTVPAAFLAALIVGFIALQLNRRFDVQLVAIIAGPIVIMIPGLYAFETIVLVNRGQMLEALQAFAACAFVIAALAMGLCAARLAGGRRVI